MVSPGQGPLALMPSARAWAMAGSMTSISSRPNLPPSPACGFRPATRRAPRDAHLATGPVGQAQRAQLGLRRDARDDVGQRHVDGHQQHAQLVIGEHHGEVRRAGAFGQDLGMAGIVDAGQVHGMLGGDDGADGARLGVVDGGADVVVGAASGLGAELPGRQVGGQGRTAADDLDQAGAQAGLGGRSDLDHVQARAQRGRAAQRAGVAVHHMRRGPAHRLDDDFRADAGGIAHGDAHGQLGVHDMRGKACLGKCYTRERRRLTAASSRCRCPWARRRRIRRSRSRVWASGRWRCWM